MRARQSVFNHFHWRSPLAGSAAFFATLSAVLLVACATRAPVQPQRLSTVVDSKWMRLNGRNVHYLEKGGGEKILVIVHGFAAYSGPFEAIIERLPGSVRVIAPDLPGHGFSDGLQGEYTMGKFVEFLKAFTNAKGLGSFSLLGSSMGANIVAHYAVRCPERVERLILLSPVGLEAQEGRAVGLSRRPLLARIVSGFVGRRVVGKVLTWASGGDTALVTSDLVDEYMLSMSTGERRSCLRSVMRNIIGGSHLEQTLPLIRQPVLIVAGDRDPLARPAHLKEFRRLLQDEKLVKLTAGGHLLHQQYPGEIARLVSEYLNASWRPLNEQRSCRCSRRRS